MLIISIFPDIARYGVKPHGYWLHGFCMPFVLQYLDFADIIYLRMEEIRNQCSGSRWGSLERNDAWRPRWRVLKCTEGQQRRASRDAHRMLAHPSSNYPFSSNAFSEYLSQLCVASFFNPVGIELYVPNLTAGNPELPFMNAQDRASSSRGITPTTIYRLKSAALKAMGKPKNIHLRSLKLAPLPHTGGEVLITHANGWTGRGIAWREGSSGLAMVWQVNMQARALPVRIGA